MTPAGIELATSRIVAQYINQQRYRVSPCLRIEVLKCTTDEISRNYLALTRVRCSRWPRDLKRGSAAAPLLGLRVRIPLRAWLSVSCECYVLSGGGFCDGPITRIEEIYRLWGV